MAGRSGWPWASRLITVARWVVITTPRMADLGMRVLAHRRWQAWHSARQNSSGSFSTQPGSGDW
jgi:hypothetical protein